MKKFLLSIVFCISAVCSCLLLSGCGQTDEDIVGERSLTFVNNLFAGNIDAIKEIAVPESVAAAKGLSGLMAANPKNKSAVATIIAGTVNENNAIVKLVIERPGEADVTITVPLIKVNDEWKVTWTKTNGGME